MTALQRLIDRIIGLSAYPELGRRIKLSQGSGLEGVLIVRGREHDEFVIGALRRGERVLGEAQESVAGMVE